MDTSSEIIDLTALKPNDQGKWVVMSRRTRQVYASNSNPAQALKKAKEAGCDDPVLHKVMPFDKGFISLT